MPRTPRTNARQKERRVVLKGAAAAWGAAWLSASRPSLAAARKPPGRAAAGASGESIWRLDRPKSALPSSFFWTWDHSTNWMLDDPGVLNFGCVNRYLKRPETYLEDYRRLTDLAAGLGIKGICLWGFLRDAHGGVESGKRVADHAASRGVAVCPGLGTNHYGGVYYEGEHRYNLETFARKYPEVRSIDEQGQPSAHATCPSHPAFADWMQEGAHWLFREFAIGGANLENGDFQVCHCARCKDQRAAAPAGEPDFWWHQYLGYNPALRALGRQLPTKLVTWATYTGFVPGRGIDSNGRPMQSEMGCERPAAVDRLPAEAVCQWTLSGMVRSKPAKPMPLTRYLDDGAPAEALVSPTWPAGVKPASKRSVGFIHQGSQWSNVPRYVNVVSTIKEGCLRAYRAGLEGVSIHGEVSARHVPWALNYLAFSHFTHWPEDSVRAWGKKTLGQVLGSEQEGEAFAELFAHHDAGALSEAQHQDIKKRSSSLRGEVSRGAELGRWRFWNWLARVSDKNTETETVSLI